MCEWEWARFPAAFAMSGIMRSTIATYVNVPAVVASRHAEIFGGMVMADVNAVATTPPTGEAQAKAMRA